MCHCVVCPPDEQLGRGFCYPRFDQPDTVLPVQAGMANSVVWYHYNEHNATYFNDTMANQGMPLDDPNLPDMFFHRAFGGALSAKELTRSTSDDVTLSGTGLATLSLQVGWAARARA